METILQIRDSLKQLYGKYEIFITPVLKFLLSMTVFIIINNNIGYMGELNSFSVVLVLSLICSLLPLNALLVLSAGMTVLHLYRLSLVCAGVVLLLFVLLFLLYFRFSPKDGLAVLLLPVCFILHIPYVVPLCAGLTGNLFSVVSVSCGVIVYYTVTFLKENSVDMGDFDIETIAEQIRTILNGILGNRTMRVMVIAFAAAVIAVYLIHRLSRRYSWTAALISGTLLLFVVILFGSLIYDLHIAILPLILGLMISFALALLLELFLFSVDYSRTEYLQFEDDEYYYYVTAVPKLTAFGPDKKPGRAGGNGSARTGGGGTGGRDAGRDAGRKTEREVQYRRSKS